MVWFDSPFLIHVWFFCFYWQIACQDQSNDYLFPKCINAHFSFPKKLDILDVNRIFRVEKRRKPTDSTSHMNFIWNHAYLHTKALHSFSHIVPWVFSVVQLFFSWTKFGTHFLDQLGFPGRNIKKKLKLASDGSWPFYDLLQLCLYIAGNGQKKMFEYKCRWWIQRGKLFCVFKIKRRHKWNFKRIWNSIRIFVCANVWLNSHMRKNHRIP